MSAAAIFEERVDPGEWASALLSAAVHLILLALLIFGVRWQNRPPEAVSVELWAPPSPAPAVEAPKPAPRVEPPPEVKIEPVKPEPVVPKPDIVLKAPPPKPKPAPKVEPKPVPPKPPAKPRDEAAQRQIREQLAREQESFDVDREKQRIREQLASDATAARSRTLADWVDKVRLKIRNNIVLPLNISGNPEAIFDVVQLPTGEVLSAKLRKSSGNGALDSAIERAILKASPLPRPDRNESAPRSFELKYRPLDPI
jgi:colicin import membrane protein